ncbi:LLM class flavin-dependent oxidoreductase [Streptomyces iconiensis]|uniref:LLM class flavin-dependent oxidoreductase n=1 Tax=Streptomyces iconiensis TaxID=1384038 RepID=A0ABT7A5A5_9ACTN|nr:LLM class flavin-dependent oxidoreductase [Streptomyces iconiensis]MDJ1135793.1 LLM class flavin-dependent oxidoreductase [Streptomyces iconiensis]
MDTPLRLGVLMPTREQAITGDHAAGQLLAFARDAQQWGFDSLWAGDSLTARPRLDPLVVLSAAGAVTSGITLGTAALTAALRHPLISANMLASLDHVCASRLILGLGSGFPVPETEAEFAAVGASYAGRAWRLDETVRLWRTAWRATEENAPTHFEGRHQRATDLDALPRPHRPGGPPLWLAASDTPGVLRRTARYYDGWLPFLPSAEAYGRARRRIASLCVDEGRPADAVVPGLYATLTVGQDSARAKEELEHYVEHYYGRPLSAMSTIQAYAWGSPAQCADRLLGYVREGARHIVVRIGSLEPALHLKQIAEEVLPAVRAGADRSAGAEPRFPSTKE